MGRSGVAGTDSLLVRPATAQDAAGVATLLGVLGYPCDRAEAANRLRALAEEADQEILVADRHGCLVGLLALDLMYYLPLGARTCRITALVVSDGEQRRGVGRMLLREAEHRARLAGAARIELTSATHRTEAHAFYNACGFNESALRFLKRLGD
ncbi:GNAT family N-acetyltransferase [Arenimonas sp.]|uniref:GNAT family N-acetyltransferase n=1 Tax=Arenimonas sp. TaxID=1872635 RepID=UPI002E321881|nr:GNAT family N-acetyltransferase [Arenimonas sp.]HEX4852742.1 GNAT family N-acetyltransferase [Arenimonas sp.]